MVWVRGLQLRAGGFKFMISDVGFLECSIWLA